MIDPIAFWGLSPLFESFLWALSQTDTRGTAEIFQDSCIVSPPAKLSQQSAFPDIEQENVPTSADVNRSGCPQTVPCKTNASRHGGFSSDPTWRINFSQWKKKKKDPWQARHSNPTQESESDSGRERKQSFSVNRFAHELHEGFLLSFAV